MKIKTRVYFIGIAGSGMLPLAKMAILNGWNVSGSDHNISDELKSELKACGIKVYKTHKPERIHNVQYVVFSSAIAADHKEKMQAEHLAGLDKIKLMHRMEFLNHLTADKQIRLALAGTHGKTSTSSLAGWLTMQAGLNPDIIVGGHPLYLDDGIRKGEGDLAISETDESDGSFLNSNAQYRLILNIDHDHLEHYGSFENLVASFFQFAKQAKLVVLNADDPELLKLINKLNSSQNNLYWYSTDPQIKTKLPYSLHSNGIIAGFLPDTDILEIQQISQIPISMKLQSNLPGRHYASNALGLLYMTFLIWPDLDLNRALESISNFPGVKRRMQLLPQHEGVNIYDDYGHHPTEIRVVLEALKLKLQKGSRLIAVFQPHRYSRTKSLYSGFAESLLIADEIVILPVFSAGEEAIEGIDGNLIVDEMIKIHKKDPANIVFMDEWNFEKIFSKTKKDDILVFLGAGDISAKVNKALQK